MPGEIWKGTTQVGKEVTAGTAVAATRKMYLENPVFTATRDFQPRDFATGTRDSIRAITSGPLMVGGNLVMPMSADELTEILSGTIVGGVTPSTVLTTGKQWVFRPGASLPDSQSWEWDDGARPWKIAGVRFNTMQISGSVAGENMVTVTPFGISMVQQALTGSLADRVPSLMQGWECQVFIDAFGATPGTTNIVGFGISWQHNYSNNLERKMYADNVNATGAVVIGKMSMNGTFTFEAEKAQALTEFNNWGALTKRLLRFQYGNNLPVIPGGTARPTVQIDIPGAWTAIDFAGTDRGTRVYQASYQYVFDPTNAFGVSFTLTNARATAYA